MSNVQDIEKAIRELSPEDLAAFSQWFAEYEAVIWDKQIESDLDSAALDELADQAIDEFRSGQTKPL